MSTIRIPTPLRPYANNESAFETSSATVEGALQELIANHPALQTHLFDEQGQLRAYVNLFINEDEIRSLNGQDTPLQPQDRLLIVPSIAGGRSAATLGVNGARS